MTEPFFPIHGEALDKSAVLDEECFIVELFKKLEEVAGFYLRTELHSSAPTSTTKWG